MNRLITVSIIALLFASKAIAQEPNYTEVMGKVTQYEMSMTEYSADKDAEAVVIHEEGENYFYPDDTRGFLLCMKYSIKIKVLKTAGIKYADFEIPYYIGSNNEREDIEDIRGTTYNLENGQLIKSEFQSSKVFEEKYMNDMRVKKFTMPNVREGSVIEISYMIKTPYFQRMREWQFQKKIPVVHSVLRYRAIPYYEYTFIMKGRDKFDEYDRKVNISEHRFGRLVYQEVDFHFGMKDLQAFKDEEFITSPRDYMISMNLQLSKILNPNGAKKEIMSTWPAICDDLLKSDSFGKYIKDAEKEGKKLLPTLNLANKTDIEKLEIITNHVKGMYNWNGVYGRYSHSDKVSHFLKNKTGNDADINLFLIGLLKAAGIETHPAALSTRENGAISSSHPFLHFLDYVLAEVTIDNKKLYVDATESLLHYTELPKRCINVRALVIKPKSEEWTVITQEKPAKTDKKLDIKIDPASLKTYISTRLTAEGNNAYNLRRNYISNKEDMGKHLKTKYNLDVKDDVQIENFQERNLPLTLSFNFESSVEGTSDKLFIKPFCGLSIEDNPFKQTIRILPIDLVFAVGENYESEIVIPEGYKVDYFPKDISQDNKILSIAYSAKQVDNKI